MEGGGVGTESGGARRPPNQEAQQHRQNQLQTIDKSASANIPKNIITNTSYMFSHSGNVSHREVGPNQNGSNDYGQPIMSRNISGRQVSNGGIDNTVGDKSSAPKPRCVVQRPMDARTRPLTVRKRSEGLVKKAYELSVLCQCDIALLIIKPDGKLLLYSNKGKGRIQEPSHGQDITAGIDEILLRHSETTEVFENRTNDDFFQLEANGQETFDEFDTKPNTRQKPSPKRAFLTRPGDTREILLPNTSAPLSASSTSSAVSPHDTISRGLLRHQVPGGMNAGSPHVHVHSHAHHTKHSGSGTSHNLNQGHGDLVAAYSSQRTHPHNSTPVYRSQHSFIGVPEMASIGLNIGPGKATSTSSASTGVAAPHGMSDLNMVVNSDSPIMDRKRFRSPRTSISETLGHHRQTQFSSFNQHSQQQHNIKHQHHSQQQSHHEHHRAVDSSLDPSKRMRM